LKKILITGASGFVGANVARRALRDGHETHLLLRPSYQPWRVEGIDSDARIHLAHLEDDSEVRRVVNEIRPDWIFHLAAFGAYSTQTGMAAMVATNLLGCVSLLDAALEAGVESFVQTGSSSEYGLKDHAPDESEPLEPNSHYAITKAAASHYCRHTALTQNIRAITLRLYSIYGPYEEPTRLVPTLITYGLRGLLPPLVDPRTARDFVYVDDAVDAIFAVAAAPSVPAGSIYNVASGIQTSLADLVTIARAQMSISVEPAWATMPQRSWDTNVWIGSPGRIQREIGWSASTKLKNGLAKTIAWLVGNSVLRQHYEAVIPALNL
jgi:nucleoside-diphosphate-sugar epimerase